MSTGSPGEPSAGCSALSSGVSSATLHSIERASGEFASASVAAMEQELSWFRRMPADQRASVVLLVQAGVGGFVEWFHDRQAALQLSAETFRAAPRELSRWISLRQAVELVRLALEVFEQRIPELAKLDERATLAEAVLR
ncbi:MAG: PucR family transcriptional regulator, partial [Sciscionella sp.]